MKFSDKYYCSYVSIPENISNVTLSENEANPFAKTKGWKDSSTGTGGGIKN
jgi:hypothetical protein